MSVCFEVIGWVVCILAGIRVLCNAGHFLYATILGSVLGKTLRPKDCGPWAAVTGATDGIGKAYAIKLASSGMNVLLISRNAKKLELVAEEIRKQVPNKIVIKTLAVDFTEGKSIYPKLRTELNSLELGVLVNNVGMIVESARFVADISNEKEINDIINCNVMSMARLCYIVLPQMIRRNRGLILNIGSLAGAMSTPTFTIYGATKAFVDKFSRDLAAEVKEHGVIVQSVLPGLVATKLARVSNGSFFTPDPKRYVDASFRTLGIESRTANFWVHRILLYIGEWACFLFPEAVADLIVKYDVMKMPPKEN